MDLAYALSIVANNGNRITLIPEELRTDEIRRRAIARTPAAIAHISDPTVDEQELAIKTQGDTDRNGIFELIEMIANIDPTVLDAAVDVNGNCIGLIPTPSDGQMKRAVKRDGDAIKHIKNPNPTLQKLSIIADCKNISYIADPDHSVVLEMIKKNPRAVEWVKNPATEHQELVLKMLPDDGLHYLSSVDDDLALRYITDNPEKIQLLQNQTEECCWAALTADGKYIKDIRNPTAEMESYAKLVSDGN